MLAHYMWSKRNQFTIIEALPGRYQKISDSGIHMRRLLVSVDAAGSIASCSEIVVETKTQDNVFVTMRCGDMHQ